MPARAFLAAALAALAWPACAQELPADLAPPPQGFVTMAGSGTAASVPDVATVRLVVVADGASFRQAFDAGAAKAAAVVSALTGAGVPQSQIRSERFQAGPVRSAEPGPGAYQVRHAMTAKVRGLARLGEVLERAASAGAGEASVPDLSADEGAAALREARARAAKDAEEKARAYATSLGIELGRIVSVAESEPARPPERTESAEGGIDLGRAEARATVTVVWEIAPRAR
jgi:uncharacterized protein YggE